MSDIVIELKKSAKQLQNAVNEQEIISILDSLKSQQVNEAILRESKIGLAVGKLRTHKLKPVADLAKEIVKHWKTAVEKAKGKTPGASSATATTADKKTQGGGTPVTPGGASAAKTDVRTAKSDNVKGDTGDKVRDKCMELLYDGLACDATAPTDLIVGRARVLEKCVLNVAGGINAEYKAKIRSLFVNLKDKANPSLRASVVEGSLSPEKLSKMTTQEMASEERKAEDKKLFEENLFKSLAAGQQEAETDAFQCSRCKQRKCVYRQQQTRSADEPMTTFVTCTVCQNKWKFS
ncbi:transcription factor S-II, central domain-containing protein [Panaeolus papilionaceus]|nr:transcription factor S-II, central domain-containing protein [Panaeolus papilionaceus]